MKFVILTLFPEIFSGFISASLIGRAVKRGIISIELVDIRNYTTDQHRTADDAPYGGGPGMIMLGEPVLDAIEDRGAGRKLLMSPQGTPFIQEDARRLAAHDEITILCGRYEGIDERVRSEFDEEISLGDFILSGGEVAAMAVVDACIRLVPGVIGNARSLDEESFSTLCLEYPQYTRPEVLKGQSVPDVLLSGNHERIRRWRRWHSLHRTLQRRPDLLDGMELSEEDRKLLDEEEP